MQFFVILILCFFIAPHKIHAQTLPFDAKTVHVLYYDNIAMEDDLSSALPFQDFERQIDYLQKEGYVFSTLQRLKESPAEKSILVLFKDARTEGIQRAKSLLKRNGLPYAVSSNNRDRNAQKYPGILSLSIHDYDIDSIQQKLNSETARFRQRNGFTPKILLLEDPAVYEEIKPLLKNYNYAHVIVPNGQATIMTKLVSAIPMDKRSANIDVLQNYLNRRHLPLDNISATIVGKKDKEIAWGFNVNGSLEAQEDHLSCQSVSGVSFKRDRIDNRFEIRLPLRTKEAQKDLICTLPIFMKNTYKSDNYRYVRLYAPVLN